MAFEYTRELIDSGFTYKAYRDMLNKELAHPAKDEAAEKFRHYTQKNVALMDEYDTWYKVGNELKAAIDNAPATTWLVITEGWCGDAAFNIPMIAALAKAAPFKVELKLFLRDTNLELIDANLTDGGRSIPKLVVLDHDFKELGNWGPRPAGLQTQMKVWKGDGLELKQIIPKVHEWYNKDATTSVQAELTALIKSYS